MTALKQYVRLECPGIWRPDPDAQRRDVGVAFGDATLVIIDSAGRPLTHWSLAAVERCNPGETPALYSPDPTAGEVLEIADDLMIDAIEKVRRAIARQQPRRGRLRGSTLAALMVALLAVAVFWLPGALTRQTLSAVAPGKRSEIGATLLGHIQRLTGPTCREEMGTQALARLYERLLGAGRSGQIVVLPEQIVGPLALPGGIVVLDRALLENTEDPAVVAGYVLATAKGAAQEDPLEVLLREAGLGATLRLLTTGDIPAAELQAHAVRLVARAPVPVADDALIATFSTAEVPVAPWAYTLDIAEDTRAALIAADPFAGQGTRPVLTDSDWIALQGICAG